MFTHAHKSWTILNALLSFADHLDTKVDFIQDELRRIYGCKVNRFKVYRAKKMALRKAGANHKLSYRLIRSYA